MNKTQFILEDFKHTQDLIKFTDQKASILIFLYGFILKVVFDYSSGLMIANPFHRPLGLTTLLSVVVFLFGSALAVLLTLQSYYILFRIIRPRFSKFKGTDNDSVFYFEHISRVSLGDFMRKFEDITEEKMQAELLTQLHQLAGILTRKTESLRVSVNLFFQSIVVMVLFIFLTSLLR